MNKALHISAECSSVHSSSSNIKNIQQHKWKRVRKGDWRRMKIMKTLCLEKWVNLEKPKYKEGDQGMTMIIYYFSELENGGNLMKWAGSRIKKNYFYMHCPIKFHNLLPSDVVETPRYKYLQKITTQKDPSSEDNFLNSYLWTVNFSSVNLSLKIMCVNMLNWIAFTICKSFLCLYFMQQLSFPFVKTCLQNFSFHLYVCELT